jgi:hypothetical protein
VIAFPYCTRTGERSAAVTTAAQPGAGGYEYLRGWRDGQNNAPAPLTGPVAYWKGYRDGLSARQEALAPTPTVA